MINAEKELRDLMDEYIARLKKVKSEMRQAKRVNDQDALFHAGGAEVALNYAIAELFGVMKKLNMLDEEEIEFGSVKRREHSRL